MNAILNFVEYIVDIVISAAIWIVVIWAILSWLVGFNVVNLRNRFVAQVSHFLDAVARPMMRPIQRVVPAPGGMDFSPLIFIVLVTGIQRFLLPPFFTWLHGLAGG